MEINGLVPAFLVISGLFGYIGWFHYRPMNRQLCYENARLRRALEEAGRRHQQENPVFDWTMDPKPSLVREARMKERLDSLYESWYE